MNPTPLSAVPSFASSAEADQFWMRRALELARCGEGYVEPNPLVGCVVVTDRLLGEGYHARFGGAHAERAALVDVVMRGNSQLLPEATAYVTLEPCCHHGKTPPCTDALIQAGVRRVVTAQLDPFRRASGHGVTMLRNAGIQVDVGIEEPAARQLNAPYLKRIEQGRPWVIAKWAMSLDGKIATHSGESQWISSEESRAWVQQLRGRMDAILVGSRTALLDNPRLTARTLEPAPRTALRVVVDSHLQLPLDSHLASTAHEIGVLLLAGPDAPTSKAHALRQLGCTVCIAPQANRQRRLMWLLKHLATRYSVTNLLVEGGGELLGGLLELRQIDQCEVFVAPTIIGGAKAANPIGGAGLERLRDTPRSSACQVRPSGPDSHISLRLEW